MKSELTAIPNGLIMHTHHRKCTLSVAFELCGNGVRTDRLFVCWFSARDSACHHFRILGAADNQIRPTNVQACERQAGYQTTSLAVRDKAQVEVEVSCQHLEFGVGVGVRLCAVKQFGGSSVYGSEPFENAQVENLADSGSDL